MCGISYWPNFLFVLMFGYDLFPKKSFISNARDFRLSVSSINIIPLNLRIFSWIDSITFQIFGVKYFLLISLWATQSMRKYISSSIEFVLQFWHMRFCNFKPMWLQASISNLWSLSRNFAGCRLSEKSVMHSWYYARLNLLLYIFDILIFCV